MTSLTAVRIVVTGATGYIGREVARRLHGDGHVVVGLTRDTSTPRAMGLERDGIAVVPGDIGDPASYRSHLGGVDVVIHTVSAADRPTASDQHLFEELLDLQRAGPVPHLVYTTGCSVYGAHRYPVLTEEVEGDATHPRFSLEQELRATGLRHTVVRPGFVFGGDARSSLLGRWLEEAHEGRSVFYGDLEKVWSWVHVDDLAAGFAAIVQRLDAVDGETFLFSDDSPVSALQTYLACQRRFGNGTSFRHAPIEEEDPLYRIFDRDEVVDSRKAQHDLSWRPVSPTVLGFIGSAATGADRSR